MAVVHNLDRASGLDLVIHTPGGGTEATRAIVEYLYKMFGKNVRVIVPHLAMSAGTMIACAASSVVMGKHSSLGPTDPHIRGHAALGVLSEIETALEEIKREPMRQIVWQEVFRKYPPSIIADCERSVAGTREMIRGWLENNMLSNFTDAGQRANNIIGELMNYRDTTDHGHHFMIDKCKAMGLLIDTLEYDQSLQEHVLSVHHTYVATFARTKALKVIENAHGYVWNIST